MIGNVLVLLDAPQYARGTVYSRFNELIRMRNLEMEWGGGMNYRIDSFYYFIECSFLDSQLETMLDVFATYFAHIRHYGIFELALIPE